MYRAAVYSQQSRASKEYVDTYEFPDSDDWAAVFKRDEGTFVDASHFGASRVDTVRDN